MIKSMTGYGSAKGTSGKLELSIELRSVNNRYLDSSIRIPRVYTSAEDAMKSVVQRHISRGKVDIYVNVDASKADDVMIRVNKPLAEAYVSAIKALAADFELKDDLTVMSLTRIPDVMQIDKAETDTKSLEKDLCVVLEEALKAFDEMRAREGEKLCHDVIARLDEIERLTARAEERSAVTVPEYRAKLEQRMKEVLQNTEIEPSFILTEAAIFADRVAVNEEVVRLRSHLAQVRALMASDEPIGRKLDFLVQELNREANTIGSKGNDLEMSRIVVDLKAEIEKIREQAQNIE